MIKIKSYAKLHTIIKQKGVSAMYYDKKVKTYLI